MATSRFAPPAPSRVRRGLKVSACAAPDEKGIASEAAVFEADGSFDAVAYINTPRWQTSRLGLERIEDLLERMGRPQDALRFVHVAGTNGKGSTCAYLSSVLASAGFKTGLFTISCAPRSPCASTPARWRPRRASIPPNSSS